MYPALGYLLVWGLSILSTVVQGAATECEREGTFLISGYCRGYYRCVFWRVGLFTKIYEDCDEGKVYDGDTDTCQQPHLVLSRPDCMPVTTTTTTTIATPTVTECEEEGTFVIKKDCDAYYTCTRMTIGSITVMSKKVFKCSLGEVFDTETKTCQENHIVVSRPDCLPELEEQQIHNFTFPALDDISLMGDNSTFGDPSEDLLPESQQTFSVDFLSVLNEAESSGTPNDLSGNDNVTDNISDETPKSGEGFSDMTPTETTESTSFRGDDLVPTTTSPDTRPTEVTDVTESPLVFDSIHEMMQKVTNISCAISQNVCVISDYVEYVIATIPLQVDHIPTSRYATFLSTYDAELERGRTIVGTWRSGHNLPNTIIEIFHLAKAYEAEFDQKYDIYQRRLPSTSQASMTDKINQLRQDIKETELDIEINEAYLETATPSTKSILLNIIERSKTDLEKKKLELQEMLNPGYDLSSLITFLQIVATDAQIIGNKTRDAKEKITIWYNTMFNFHGNFESKSTDFDKYIGEFNKYVTRNENSIRKLQNELDGFERELKTAQMSIPKLERGIGRNIQTIKSKLNAIKEKVRQHDAMIAEYCSPRGDNKFTIMRLFLRFRDFQLACRVLARSINPHLDIRKDVRELGRLQKVLDKLNEELLKEVVKHSVTLSFTPENIQERREKIKGHQSSIRTVNIEINRSQVLLAQLKDIKDSWYPAHQALKTVMNSFEVVEFTFQTIHSYLDGMVQQVMEIQNLDEKNDARFNEMKDDIDIKLKKIQADIDHSSSIICEVTRCS